MLDPAQLLASEIVANATMNRERGLAGVNSYKKVLRFDVVAFLKTRVEARGHAIWYDACCGSGQALIEAARQFQKTGCGDQVRIIGADLVDAFAAEMPPTIQILTGDVTALSLGIPADLITCVHGLHYLGDKLGFIQRAYQSLAPGGLFLGQIDPKNLHLPIPWAQLLRQNHGQGIDIDFRSHLLRVTRTDRPLEFGVPYQGATVSERPNYTGITVIDSWYTQSSD